MNNPWKRRVEIGAYLENVQFSGFPNTVTFYGVRDKVGGDIQYVGGTSQKITSRIRSHIADANKGSRLPVHKWMRAENFSFQVVSLGHSPSSERHDYERLLVAQHKPPLNVTDGGAGLSGHTFKGSSHANRIASKLRTGAHFNCEVCAEEFWRKAREIRLGNNRFCSRGCYHAWQRGRPKKRTAA